jgi:hypothetical protein
VVDVSVVTSGHDVSDARLHRVSAALLARGLTVEVLGLGDAAQGPEGARVTATPRGGLAARALAAPRKALAARGSVLVALDPDSLVACLVVGRLRRRRVVADVHEDYAALLADRPWASGWRGTVGRALARVATVAARRADLVVVADEHVPPLTGRHRLVLRNVPDLAMLPPLGAAGATPRAIYVGDVRGSRGLWSMLDAVERAPDWHLDIVGPVAGADADRLADRLAAAGLRDRVTLHGRMPPRRAWALAEGAWCGLALLEDTPAFRAAMPSKLYEYLGCGLAVVVTDLPRQAELVRASGGGDVVPPGPGAGAATAAVLNGWAERPATLAARREAAARWRSDALQHNPYADLAASIAALTARHTTGDARPA